MSFLDNFSFAFQDVILLKKEYKTGKYGEKIPNGDVKQTFKGIIQEKRDLKEVFIGAGDNFKLTSKDFILRSDLSVLPSVGDTIEKGINKYKVIYVEKVSIEGKDDHNLSLLRLTNYGGIGN